MASPSEDALVQSPISIEERILSTDVELPSKSDMPPLLKHMYIL